MQQVYIIVAGLIFGLLISYAGLNKFNTIAGLSVLKNMTVAKTIMLVLGIGTILLTIEIMCGFATFHIKPFFVIGTILGGIIFGCGMSVLGYCPGTLPVSVGQGSLDAVVGIIGGLVGGLFFSIFYPYIIPLLGKNLGNISLFSILGNHFSFIYFFIVLLLSSAMIVGAFILHRIDVRNGITSNKWIITGIGLALLNLILFDTHWFDTPMGASSCYPYIANHLVGVSNSVYSTKISFSGNWEMYFLLGAMIAGYIQAALSKSFKIIYVHSLWIEYRGNNITKRFVWAFIGGFLLIFGARMAGGCTSGHIISGGMQVAVSSYVFAIFTFIGFLCTGYVFYKLHLKG